MTSKPDNPTAAPPEAPASALTADPFRPPRWHPSTLSVLTDREFTVLRGVACGLDDNAIAAALFLAPSTVKSHADRIRRKFGIRGNCGRALLVLLAVELGVLMPSWTERCVYRPAEPLGRGWFPHQPSLADVNSLDPNVGTARGWE